MEWVAGECYSSAAITVLQKDPGALHGNKHIRINARTLLAVAARARLAELQTGCGLMRVTKAYT